MTTIYTTTGNENQPDQHVIIKCFPLEKENGKIDLKNKSIVQLSENARQGVPREIGGQWLDVKREVENGTVIKLSFTSKGSLGMPTVEIHYLLAHEDADCQEWNLTLVNCQDSARAEVCLISGRFVSLTFEQARYHCPGLRDIPWNRSNMVDLEDSVVNRRLLMSGTFVPGEVKEVVRRGESILIEKNSEPVRFIRRRRKNNK